MNVDHLYRAHARAAQALAYRLLGDRELAADAVQQAFLQVWRAADAYDPARPVEPWLFAIVRRAAIDVYRRQRDHAGTTPLDEAGVDPVAPGAGGIERAWHVREVRRAIRRLPAADRDIITLAYFADLAHREIAVELGIPVGTVKSRLFRAQRRLAGLLAHVSSRPAGWPDPVAAQESSHAC